MNLFEFKIGIMNKSELTETLNRLNKKRKNSTGKKKENINKMIEMTERELAQYKRGEPI